MKVIRLVFMIALAMALTITLITMKNNSTTEKNSSSEPEPETLPDEKILKPSKRLSRFLAEKPKNPRAADHCKKKDNEFCDKVLGLELEGRNATCCNNKCVYLKDDTYNCGACKKKCLPFEACCKGKCVNVSYDKRHCGYCNNRCMPGGYCIYGICDYA